MAGPDTPGRRERLRTATIAEIKQVARRLLVAGGPGAISLRAIAREMGMTAGALYRYYPSLDGLVDALCGDLFEELTAALHAARDEVSGDEPTADEPTSRVARMARAFRRWALDHPAEFGLMLGPRLPGVTRMWADREQPHESTFRFGSAFLDEFAELWRRHPVAVPSPDLLEQRLRPQLGPYVARRGDDLPLGVVVVFLTAWIRLYGLVAMEVFGHLRWALTDAEALFEIELANFARQLTGVPDDTDRPDGDRSSGG
ncbi:MAG TPA: TetR/AcrR family transcriptional regulator [Micromonosporaceae bacterium]